MSPRPGRSRGPGHPEHTRKRSGEYTRPRNPWSGPEQRGSLCVVEVDVRLDPIRLGIRSRCRDRRSA
jgi:hypothetical protein